MGNRPVRTVGDTITATAHPSASSRSAFSLLELVLVIAIVGVLSAIAIPRYSSASARYSSEAAARRVVADLALASSEAYGASATKTVKLDIETDVLVVGDLSPLNGTGEVYTTDFSEEPYGADIIQANFGGDPDFYFDIYGKPSAGGSILLQVGSYQQTIYLDAYTGKASMQGAFRLIAETEAE